MVSKNPIDGTMEIFLEEMSVLLQKYYKNDWQKHLTIYKVLEEETVEVIIWFPSDKKTDE